MDSEAPERRQRNGSCHMMSPSDSEICDQAAQHRTVELDHDNLPPFSIDYGSVWLKSQQFGAQSWGSEGQNDYPEPERPNQEPSKLPSG